jgi:hypothetical protein
VLLSLLLLMAMPFPAAASGGSGNQSSASRDGAPSKSAMQSSAVSNEKNDQKNETTSQSCGPPDYKCSYDGVDPKPLCNNCNLPTIPDMSAEPNAVSYDKVFGTQSEGNQIVRCTYPDTQKNNNHTYVIGSGGSGDSNVIGKAGGNPPSYRLIIGDTHGSSYPFTYTPDPVHPTCLPTYTPMSIFPVGDGSFSWTTPHLYYFFGNFKVKDVDLGSRRPPTPNIIADFQQILPRTGSDWPGPNQTVALGTIIAPHKDNAGKFLYQATCPARLTTCSSGITGATAPSFNQNVMTNTGDGTVIWRNIGVGFDGPPYWSVIGGVSTDDDVFVKGFSDAGGQGGPGAIFVAAYKRSANTYYLFNAGTGIISYIKCSGGTGYSCSGGRWAQTIMGMTSLPDRFLIHNVKVNKNGQWVVIVQEECRFGSCSIVSEGFGPYFWRLTENNAKVKKVTTHPNGHWTEGYRLFVNQNGEPGVMLNARSFSDPENQFPLNRFSTNAPWFSLPLEGTDAHPSWNYNDGTDTTPVCTATASRDWPYVIPWENEVICYGTNPNPDCSTNGHGLCQTTIKRFFHTYNPGTCDQNSGFWGCSGIGALSQDGKYYAFTSNWGDTLGSSLSGGHGLGSCRGGFNFQENHDYQVGDAFEPSNGGHGHANGDFNVFQVTVAGRSSSYPPGAWPTGWRLKQNAGQGFYQNGDTTLPRFGNPCNHLFQVTAGGGTANGSKFPDWQKAYAYSGSCSSVASGATITDGGITWTDIGEFALGTLHLANLGRDNCRSDVFIGELK